MENVRKDCDGTLSQVILVSRLSIELAVPGVIRASVLETFGKLLDRLFSGETNRIGFSVGALSEGEEWKAKR